MRNLQLAITSNSYRREISRLQQLFQTFVTLIGQGQFEHYSLLYLCDRDISGHDDWAISQNFYSFLISPNMKLTEVEHEFARYCMLKQRAKQEFQIMMTYFRFMPGRASEAIPAKRPFYLLIAYDGSTIREHEVCRHSFFILNWLRLKCSIDQVLENMARMKIPKNKLRNVFNLLKNHSVQIENLVGLNDEFDF